MKPIKRLGGSGGGTRTPDTRSMIPLLYPAELHRHFVISSRPARDLG